MISLLSVVAVAYLGLLLLVAVLQKKMIYFPSRAAEPELLGLAEREGLAAWRDSAGRLIGWRTRQSSAGQPAQQRVVVFHGNAGFALHRTYYVDGFRAAPGGGHLWEVYLFEYPGYGARAGSPGEAAILSAAREALLELQRGDARPLFLLGESLGTSVAARLAAESTGPIAGLILVTPFTRLADVAASHYRILPVRLMLRERHEVQSYLQTYPGPVAFLLAGQDEIIPARLGRKLFDQYSGRKRLWTQPQAGHNTLDLSPGSTWWRDVSEFLRSQDPSRPARP